MTCAHWGGTLLTGGDLTHFVYLDEAGITTGDPVAVVSGPIIESRRALSIQNYMRLKLIELLRPDTLPNNFVISAKDLFHGTRSFRDEAVWPAERRFEILRFILQVPRLFNLPTVVGWVKRNAAAEAEEDHKRRLILAHARAFILAAAPVEDYMRNHGNWDSVATMVVENNTDTRAAVINMARNLRSAKFVKERLDPQIQEYFPLTRVLEDPMFVEKAWSHLMLMADACSFSLCRWYRGFYAEWLLDELLGDVRPSFPPEHDAGHETFHLSRCCLQRY